MKPDSDGRFKPETEPVGAVGWRKNSPSPQTSFSEAASGFLPGYRRVGNTKIVSESLKPGDADFSLIGR
jgi:hypothetical protein